jgi:hypothetical protein
VQVGREAEGDRAQDAQEHPRARGTPAGRDVGGRSGHGEPPGGRAPATARRRPRRPAPLWTAARRSGHNGQVSAASPPRCVGEPRRGLGAGGAGPMSARAHNCVS